MPSLPVRNEASPPRPRFPSCLSFRHDNAVYRIDRVVTDGNVGVAECGISATHQAEFMGLPATGRPIEFPAVFVGEVSNARVTHWRAYFDTGTMMRQLGVGT